MEEINKFDSLFKFLVEDMEEDRSDFLDTTVIFENNELNLRQFRKPSSSNCMANFKIGVSRGHWTSFRIPDGTGNSPETKLFGPWYTSPRNSGWNHHVKKKLTNNRHRHPYI